MRGGPSKPLLWLTLFPWFYSNFLTCDQFFDNTMSQIVSVVSGEAEESETDEEVSSNDNDEAGTSNGEDDSSKTSDGASGTGDGLRPSRPPRPRPHRTLSAQPGVIVQGEASETDSDEDTDTKPKRSVSDPARHDGLPPLKVELPPRKEVAQPLPQKTQQSQNGMMPPLKEASKYDTLLHRKLRERNASLQGDIHEAVAGVFLTSARELAEANQMLSKSQSVIQDVCHNLRVFTTDLKQIEQKLDTISSCANIPNISTDAKREP